jgi:regulator of sigma E protease
MRFILVFLAFNLIVIVHEIGHFMVAKLSDIQVHEFSIFFGPKLFGFKKGETEYNFRLLPLGGYVRMEGEEEKSESKRAYNKKPLLVRAAVLFSGPLANLLFALITLTIVISITGYSTTVIDTVVEGSPAERAGLMAGDKVISYDGRRIYQTMDLGVFLYYTVKGEPAPIVVERNGTRQEYILQADVIPPQERYIFGFVPKSAEGTDSNVVQSVDAASPAGKAGLLPGDKIIRLDDIEITNRQQINDYTMQKKDNPIKVTVLRDGSEKELNITPYLVKSDERYDLGLIFATAEPNILSAIGQAVAYSLSTIRSSYLSILWMITGAVAIGQAMGPVGIIDAMNDVVQQSPTFSLVILNLLNVSAFISIALGISNLLPIPPADGSKLVLLGVEGIRRKPIPIEKEAFIMMAGFIIMLLLLVILTYNDILRVFFS